LIASFAALVNGSLSGRGARDSQNTLTALLGTSKIARQHLVEQAGTLSIRQGRWKYIEPGNGARVNQNTNTELGNDPKGQLYDLGNDPGERSNLAEAHPEKVRELSTRHHPTTIEQQIQGDGSRQTKLDASFVSPLPAYAATFGYGHSGRSRSTTPFNERVAMT
jgi:hypothetical protein